MRFDLVMVRREMLNTVVIPSEAEMFGLGRSNNGVMVSSGVNEGDLMRVDVNVGYDALG